jgi:signal transduction histidine kinase
MRSLEERSAALERANLALQEAQGALLRAEKLTSVGTLAAGLAHEIANPLSCIKSGSAALSSYLDELGDAMAMPGAAGRDEGLRALAEARSIAGELSAGSRRIERIAADLRVFAGPEKVVDETVDVADAVEDAWTIARARFAALPRLVLERGACGPVRTSGPLVRQVLLVVLENAVQAAGPGGLVTVAVRSITDGVEIAVQDSGAGIPRELLPRVFDPFFTPRSPGAASGLGLAVAYGIANGLGGDIAVESPPGEGALFRVRLPRAPGAFARGSDAA